MKFGPKLLRFYHPAWPWSARRLVFVGKQNTIHLQETALVVEGELKRLSLPILDQFVQRALSEWSMVTVPYSRIVRHVYATYWGLKLLYWLGAGGLLALLVVLLIHSSEPDVWPFAIMSVALLVMVGVLIHLLLWPRHLLVFRHADGRRRLLCFYFKSRQKRREFMKRLEENRKAARPAAEK